MQRGNGKIKDTKMAAGSDVKDILDIAGSGEKEFMTKDALMNSDKRVGKVKWPCIPLETWLTPNHMFLRCLNIFQTFFLSYMSLSWHFI